MTITTIQPSAANTNGTQVDVHLKFATADAAPSTPSAMTIATMRPISSTTLPACCSVSMRKPNTKPGIKERIGSLSSCGSGRKPRYAPAQYISATSAAPPTQPHPKPLSAADFRVTREVVPPKGTRAV